MKPTVSVTRMRGSGLGLQRAHRGVERREQLVGDQHLAAGERAHQRGLAGVGVADQRHAREPWRACRRARCVLRSRIDRRARAAARRCGRGSCAGRARRATRRRPCRRCRRAAPGRRPAWPRAGAAPCSPGARSRPAAREARARVAVEDLEDDIAADLLLQVERLRGRDFVVDEDRVGGLFFAQEPQLLALAVPEVRLRVEPGSASA